MGNYINVTVNGKRIGEHRHVYQQHRGPIQPGMHIHHIDGDPTNNAIENLTALTPEEHSRLHNDKHPRRRECDVCGTTYEPAATKRSRSRTCSRECFGALMAQRKGTASGTAKADEEMVIAIRRRVIAGEQQKALAAEYGLSKACVSNIVRRKTWTHVPPLLGEAILRTVVAR